MQVPVTMVGGSTRSPGGSWAASILEWQTPVVRARQAICGQSTFWQVVQPAAFHLARRSASSTVEVTQTLQPEQPRPVEAVIAHWSVAVGLHMRARISAAL